MRVSSWKSISGTIAAMFCLAVLLSATAEPPQPQVVAAPAHEFVLAVDAGQSKVHWTLDTSLHTVHGTFNLKGGLLHIAPDSGKANGEIVVLATSGESGNSSRDERMHKEILETAKFPDVIFRPIQVDGKVSASGASDVSVRGQIQLHGGTHGLTVPMHVDMYGQQWKATGKFDVPFVEWGVKDPSNWLLKTQKVVTVELEMTGTVKSE